METEAYKAFRDSGKVQYPEFGTPVPALKSLWLAFLGMTGFGQGKLPHQLLMPTAKHIFSAGHLHIQIYRIPITLHTGVRS